VVAYEILQATQISCPLEMHKIPVTKCDPAFDPNCEGLTMIPFTRAKYDKETGRGFNVPREQVTSFFCLFSVTRNFNDANSNLYE
jgi:dual oxidase